MDSLLSKLLSCSGDGEIFSSSRLDLDLVWFESGLRLRSISRSRSSAVAIVISTSELAELSDGDLRELFCRMYGLASAVRELRLRL